jgi:hypothetical protein
MSFEQQQEITAILESYRTNPSNSNKYRFELFAYIDKILAAHQAEVERIIGPDEPMRQEGYRVAIGNESFEAYEGRIAARNALRTEQRRASEQANKGEK